MTIMIRPGVRVCTLQGDQDTDHENEERHAEPGTWGYITGKNHDDRDGVANWDVLFPNGCWVVPTQLQLQDPSQYTLEPPHTTEQLLLSAQYLNGPGELTIFDEPMCNDLAQLIADAPRMLELIKRAGEALEFIAGFEGGDNQPGCEGCTKLAQQLRAAVEGVR